MLLQSLESGATHTTGSQTPGSAPFAALDFDRKIESYSITSCMKEVRASDYQKDFTMASCMRDFTVASCMHDGSGETGITP